MPEFGGTWIDLPTGQSQSALQILQIGDLGAMFCSAAEPLAAILHSIPQDETKKLQWKSTRVSIPKP